jgi:DNA polymerase elongation subunit (family B)
VTYTVYGDDETELLTKIAKVLNRADDTHKVLCGHNIIVFDLNVIAKRMMHHGIDIPKNIPKSSQAPWIVDKMVLDTKREYSGGNIFKPSSLKLLCAFFGVESSKEGDVNGERMHEYYWSDSRDLEKIKEYCERDIEAQHEVTKILIDRKVIDENERF